MQESEATSAPEARLDNIKLSIRTAQLTALFIGVTGHIIQATTSSDIKPSPCTEATDPRYGNFAHQSLAGPAVHWFFPLTVLPGNARTGFLVARHGAYNALDRETR